MAKSKWEQLYVIMNTVTKSIEQYTQMIKKLVSHYNLLQMNNFHRDLLNPDQIPSNYSKYMEIAKTHCVFLKLFCSDENLKKEFQKPFLKDPNFYLPVRSIPDVDVNFKKIVKWFVCIDFNAEIASKLSDLPFELLLYCPFQGEYEKRQKWFEKDNQMYTLNLESLKEQIVLENLASPIEKHFKTFMKCGTLS